MDKFKDFYNSFGFIISFMFVCIVISATVGEKFLNKFLILILTSQILINSKDTIELIGKFILKEPEKETVKEGLDENNALNSNNAINNGKMKV